MVKVVEAVVEQPTRLENLTRPYTRDGLCYGSNRDLVQMLADPDNKFFVLVRIEPLDRNFQREAQAVFGLIDKLCQNRRFKPVINRLVDLHIGTGWSYPVVITLVASSQERIERNLLELFTILKYCLDDDSIEEFRISWDKDHAQWADAHSKHLVEVGKTGLKVEPSAVKTYSREELEEVLSFFISPHPSSCGHSSSWD